MHTAQFTNALCSAGSGVHCSLDRRDIAFDQDRDKTTSHALLTSKAFDLARAV